MYNTQENTMLKRIEDLIETHLPKFIDALRSEFNKTNPESDYDDIHSWTSVCFIIGLKCAHVLSQESIMSPYL
jgi:hypothetical protein